MFLDELSSGYTSYAIEYRLTESMTISQTSGTDCRITIPHGRVLWVSNICSARPVKRYKLMVNATLQTDVPLFVSRTVYPAYRYWKLFVCTHGPVFHAHRLSFHFSSINYTQHAQMTTASLDPDSTVEWLRLVFLIHIRGLLPENNAEYMRVNIG